MAKLGKIILESIVAGSLIFGIPSVLAQQKKPEYIVKVDYFNPANVKGTKREDSEKFIKEKLKGYDAKVVEETTEDGKKYSILMNVYDNRLNKDKLNEKIQGISGYYTETWTKKEYDDKSELGKIYVKMVEDFYITGNFESFRKNLDSKVLDVTSRKNEAYISFGDIKAVQAAKTLKLNSKSYAIVSAFYINATKVSDLNPDVYKDRKLYKPKEDDYRLNGRVCFKIKGEKKDLELDMIFRKINGSWKVIAFD